MAEWISVYGKPYDPRPAIERWRAGEASSAAAELWEQLYHQGDVNTASYAAAGEIVQLILDMPSPDWNAYALLASIEDGRLSERGPAVPNALERGYHEAWAAVLPKTLHDFKDAVDDLTVRSIMAVIALVKGQRSVAAITLCTEDERQAMLGGI